MNLADAHGENAIAIAYTLETQDGFAIASLSVLKVSFNHFRNGAMETFETYLFFFFRLKIQSFTQFGLSFR